MNYGKRNYKKERQENKTKKHQIPIHIYQAQHNNITVKANFKSTSTTKY